MQHVLDYHYHYHRCIARIRLNAPSWLRNIDTYESTSCPHTRRLCATGRTVVRRTQPCRGAAARANADTAACHCGADRGTADTNDGAANVHCHAANIHRCASHFHCRAAHA